MDTNELREQMIQEWGLQGFASEEQDAYIDKIGEVLYQSTVLRATEALDETQSAELDAYMAEKGDGFSAAEALDWLRSRVPGFDQIAAEETAKLKERIVAMPQA